MENDATLDKQNLKAKELKRQGGREEEGEEGGGGEFTRVYGIFPTAIVSVSYQLPLRLHGWQCRE